MHFTNTFKMPQRNFQTTLRVEKRKSRHSKHPILDVTFYRIPSKIPLIDEYGMMPIIYKQIDKDDLEILKQDWYLKKNFEGLDVVLRKKDYLEFGRSKNNSAIVYVYIRDKVNGFQRNTLIGGIFDSNEEKINKQIQKYLKLMVENLRDENTTFSDYMFEDL